jgi:hypothetical protein
MNSWKHIRDAMIMFIIQTFNYGMMVVNYRAVAQANYFWSALSDFMLATFSFFVIKKIANSDDSWHLWFGYAMGGVAGSLLGIEISLLIHGH